MGLLGLINSLGAPWAVQVPRDLPAYHHHGPLFFLWTAAFLGLWTSGWPRGPACLAWIGRRITAFYVAQWLLVGNLATALYRTQGPWECAGWFVVLTLGAAALAWGWDSCRHDFVT